MRHKRMRLLATFFVAILAGSCLRAQETLKPSVGNEQLLREIEALRQEVKDIKNLLENQQASMPVGATRVQTLPEVLNQSITIPFVPKQFIGSDSAKYVIVEFADLQCPFCAYFNKNAFPAFKKQYVDTGKYRFRSVDFPLESHPDANQMALASVCAGDQGKYWEMRDLMMQAVL